MIKYILESVRPKLWAWLIVAVILLLISRCSYAQNIGFESGNLSGWTTSGGDVTVSTGTGSVSYGGGLTWNISPYGTYMGQLYPSGGVTFDSATSSLGLNSTENASIKQFMTNNAGGGSPTPTNASWIKKTVTLQAGTTYTFAWNYLSTDYTPFNDGSMISLVHTTNSNIIPTLNNFQQRYGLLGFTNPGSGNYSTDSYGSTGWQVATFTVPETGDYVLGFSTFNLGDTALSPMLFIDELQGTTTLNGQPFTPIEPNAGSGVPSANDGSGPTVVSSSTSNSVTTSSTTSNTSSISITRPTVTGNYNDLYVGSTTVTTTTTTPVTTETWSDGNTTTTYGDPTVTTETTYTITPTYGTAPTYSRAAPNIGGNSIYIKQVYAGSNTNVSLEQDGNNNAITGTDSGWATVDGNNSIISVKQFGQGNITGLKMNAWGNNININQGSSAAAANDNIFNLESAGNGNSVTVNQQSNTNTASVKLTYDINTVNVTQKTGTDNQSYITVNGNWNGVTTTQTGSNNFSLVNISGDNNSATVNQTGVGHVSLLNLINAGGANTVNVTQTGTGDAYSLQQTCTNPAGCSVSVIRNK